jgi:hypothetical protein
MGSGRRKVIGVRRKTYTLIYLDPKTVTCFAEVKVEKKKQRHLVKHRLDALLGWRVQLFIGQNGVGGQLGNLIPFDGLKNTVWFSHPSVDVIEGEGLLPCWSSPNFILDILITLHFQSSTSDLALPV